ncbi:recombinase family protein [Demequina aurantiaca]|uniref:recombinase family protein n=1 Tax=Demequina aurantiaca TaxID=676200 RepID=UPI003D3552A8
MTNRHAVALYARISRDPNGDMLGVTRQLEDCRAEAERRGWTVLEEYVDDDTSAYSGKKRAAYERLLQDITSGRVDAVIVYRMDRLHRQPIELERFATTCKDAGLADVVSLQGEFDMGKSDGLFLARLMANVAAHESQVKSERIKRKFLQVAETGAPYMGGGHRPFGFNEDRVTHFEAEAEVLRDAAERVLSGESLNAVARSIDERGFTGSKGSRFTGSGLRTLLLRPRNHGMRVHDGQPIAKGTWEPIIAPETAERLRLLLTDPARRTNRTARRYLLSGMLRCGKCGAKLASRPRGQDRRYACGMLTTANVPCSGVYISAPSLEAFIAEAVLVRLDSPVMLETLTRSPEDGRVPEVGDQIATDTQRMKDLADMWADGEISREEWKAARDRVESRLEANRRMLARLTQHDAIEDYIGHGHTLRAKWDTLALSQQVPIIKAVLEYATITPAKKRGFKGLDIDRVVPTWRL